MMAPFLRFLIQMGPYYMPLLELIAPHFLQKKGLSLSHLVPEILEPKFGQTFYQNVLFNIFKHFA